MPTRASSTSSQDSRWERAVERSAARTYSPGQLDASVELSESMLRHTSGASQHHAGIRYASPSRNSSADQVKAAASQRNRSRSSSRNARGRPSRRSDSAGSPTGRPASVNRASVTSRSYPLAGELSETQILEARIAKLKDRPMSPVEWTTQLSSLTIFAANLEAEIAVHLPWQAAANLQLPPRA